MTKQNIRETLYYNLPGVFLSKINSSMRAIQFEHTDNMVTVRCYFDGEITEEILRDMDEAETDLLSHFNPAMAMIECIRVDMPDPIVGNNSSKWFYMRKEP